MSDLKYQVSVDASRGVASLNQLQQRVGQTTTAFQRLQGIVAGLAIAGTIRGVMQMSNRITDLSAATGIATRNIIGFTQAVAANGGSIELGEKAITRFGQSIGSAIEGSDKAAEAFEKLGISLSDLRNLSQEEILRRTVEGLAGVENASVRARQATELFGRAVATVDFSGLNNTLDGFIERSGRYDSGVQAAGAANQALADSMRILQLEVARLIEPLSNLIIKLTENKEAVAQFAEAFIKIVAVLTGAAVVGRIAAGFGALAAAIGLGATKAATFLSLISRFAGPIGLIVSAIVAVNAAIRSAFNIDLLSGFSDFLGSTVVYMFERIAEVLKDVKAIYDNIFQNENIRNLSFEQLISSGRETNEVLEELERRLSNFRGPEFLQNLTMLPESRLLRDRMREYVETTRQKIAADELMAAAEESAAAASRIRAEMFREQLEPFARYIEQARAFAEIDYSTPLERAAERVRIAEEAVNGLLEAYQTININALPDFNQLLEASQRELDDARRSLNELERDLQGFTFNDFFEGLVESSQRAVTEIGYNQQALGRLEAALASGAISQEVYAEAVRRVNSALGIANEELAEQVNNLERINDITTSYVERLDRSISDAQFEFEMLNMDPLERQIARINRGLETDLQNAIRELQALSNETNAADIAARIEEITRATRAAQSAQADLARRSYDHQRSFVTGWSDAFRRYRDEATNAARTAQTVFEQTTRGLEDAIVGFARTGKFEWKEFVRDIGETLLRANIRNMISSLFESTGLGNLFGIDTGSSQSAQQRGANPGSPMFVHDVANGVIPTQINQTLGTVNDSIKGGTNQIGGWFNNLLSGLLGGFGNIFSNIIGAIGGIGNGIVSAISGLLGGIGNLFGGSGGGFLGSLGSAVSGLFGGVGKVVSGLVGGIGSAIGGVVGGVGKLFGGFFATGGQIPAGRFGVVGERGRELVSGPATITPFEDMVSQITYNINAIDARSFQDLIAADPAFLHAVVQRGARRIPGGAR